MFVQTNSVKAIRSYFKEKLALTFSDNEIKLIGNEVICSRLNLSREDLIGVNDLLLSESDLLYFRSIVKRLLKNEPFQYITETAYFYELKLKCDKRALIPRPETEELVDWVKESFLNKTTPELIADICTGSGCIALSLKSIYLKSIVIATDISNDALSLSRENSEHTNLNIELINFSALDELSYFEKGNFIPNSFDCWVSNPPYIPIVEKYEMALNVLDHEPHIALFVPDDEALIFYEKIAKMAKIYLKPEGLLFFEIHENLSLEVLEILEDLNFNSIEIKLDLQGKTRMVKAKK